MKIEIKNLGIVSDMEFDFSKSFVLFAGSNGSGKTYVTSFIYTLLLYVESYIFKQIKSNDENLLVNQLLMNGERQIDSDSIYDVFSTAMESTMIDVLRSLHLNINRRMFSCRLVTTKEEWRKEFFESALALITNGNFVKKQKNSSQLSINLDSSKVSEDRICVMKTSFLSFLFFDRIIGAHMFTAERNGIYTFGKEISYGRLRLPEQSHLFVYPRPIVDSIAVATTLSEYRNSQSESYQFFANEIENQILHGNLEVNDEGEVTFLYNKKRLGINQVSSTTKTLAPLVFYLRYMANYKNLLLIDEPELNLHPENQVVLARILGRMINKGIKVIISTHSDYIIREINNMIMANELLKRKDSTGVELGYDSECVVKKEQFAAYYFDLYPTKKVNVRSLMVDEFGFKMPSIDETIERQNAVTDDLYDTLKYKYAVCTK